MADFTPPDDADPSLISTQRQLLLNQVTEHRAKIASFSRQQAQKEAEQATIAASIRKLETIIPVIQPRVDIATAPNRSLQPNSQKEVITRPELADRSIFLTLPPIADAHGGSRSGTVRSYFFHDPLDGVGAPAALGAAAEVAVNLAYPRPSSGLRNSGLKLMVAEHVARADDH